MPLAADDAGTAPFAEQLPPISTMSPAVAAAVEVRRERRWPRQVSRTNRWRPRSSRTA